MVASYSPASGYRSGGRSSLIAQVSQGVKDALADLKSNRVSQSQWHSSFPTSAFTASAQTISQLATLPHNTFGHQWLTLIESTGANDDTAPYSPCLHSLHVLTGYETDQIGQAELQAFLFGATGQIRSFAQCITNVKALACKPQSSSPKAALSSRLYHAYQRGRTSYFDLSHWHPEQLWDLPLPYVRQWFGLSAQ